MTTYAQAPSPLNLSEFHPTEGQYNAALRALDAATPNLGIIPDAWLGYVAEGSIRRLLTQGMIETLSPGVRRKLCDTGRFFRAALGEHDMKTGNTVISARLGVEAMRSLLYTGYRDGEWCDERTREVRDADTGPNVVRETNQTPTTFEQDPYYAPPGGPDVEDSGTGPEEM